MLPGERSSIEGRLGRIIAVTMGVACRGRGGEVKGGRAWGVDAGVGGGSGGWDWGGVGGGDGQVQKKEAGREER